MPLLQIGPTWPLVSWNEGMEKTMETTIGFGDDRDYMGSRGLGFRVWKEWKETTILGDIGEDRRIHSFIPG